MCVQIWTVSPSVYLAKMYWFLAFGFTCRKILLRVFTVPSAIACSDLSIHAIPVFTLNIRQYFSLILSWHLLDGLIWGFLWNWFCHLILYEQWGPFCKLMIMHWLHKLFFPALLHSAHGVMFRLRWHHLLVLTDDFTICFNLRRSGPCI